MATITQVISNGAPKASTNSADVKDILVNYDYNNRGVSVTPTSVDKGTTARFRNVQQGGKLRIVFLSPTGKETDEVLDSELCTLMIGGTYHFKCFFTAPGSSIEESPETGGVIDVYPPRP